MLWIIICRWRVGDQWAQTLDLGEENEKMNHWCHLIIVMTVHLIINTEWSQGFLILFKWSHSDPLCNYYLVMDGRLCGLVQDTATRWVSGAGSGSQW